MRKRLNDKIEEYLEQYAKQKEEHSNYIDYYELFGFDKSSSYDDLRKEVMSIEKSLKVISHPDNANYLNPELKELYNNFVDDMNNMLNIFTSKDIKLRQNYDASLQTSIEQDKLKENSKIQLYGYLREYVIQKEEHDDYINYYKLFGLNSSSNINELNQVIKSKKIEELFQSNQKQDIEEYFQDSFEQCYMDFKNMIQIFSNQSTKEQYDKMLNEKENITNTTKVDLEEIDEKEVLEDAITTTINNHGFNNGYFALQHALRGDFSHVSRDRGNRNLLKAIGKEKLREIVTDERENIMERNGDNLVAEYFHKLISKSPLKEKADNFYNVCIETINEKNSNPYINSLEDALKMYIEFDYPSGFSNRNNARDKFLQNNANNKDAWLLMDIMIHNELGNKDDEYLFSNVAKKNMDEQCRIFSGIMQKEAQKLQAQSK